LKGQYFIETPIRAFLVAVIAGNYRVRAIQWESRIVMHRDGKFRPFKIIDRMTGFTTVLVRRLCELRIMSVPVTIDAVRKFDFENRIRPGGDVALAAFHAGVLAHQRICGGGVVRHAKQARLPPIRGVAERAFPFARAILTLPFVRIGIVAIHALGVPNRGLEIGVFVAVGANNGAMLSEQGKTRC
jgi:hypothetical protein